MYTQPEVRAPAAGIVRRPMWTKKKMSVPVPIDKDWLLSLARNLQTTINLDRLVDVFATDSAAVVAFDGLTYEEQERNILMAWGTPGLHSCRYELNLNEERLGRLVFTRAQRFADEETMRLEFLVSNLVYPLRNALLYHDAVLAASLDPLTGINNRSSLEGTLDREISLARRHHSPLSVIMLDLDHFKRINDGYGHFAGDCILKAFVNKVRECIRLSDVLFRYGGEEFTIVLRNTDLAGAALLAERIRQAVQDMETPCKGVSLCITVSSGVAALAEEDGTRELLHKADDALYRSKGDGRNRVTSLQ